MLSLIICEGSTDLVLLQYILEEIHNWRYIECKRHNNYKDIIMNIGSDKNTKWFKKNDNFLCVQSAGGCTKICSTLDSILEINSIKTENFFENIVILTDNDDIDTPLKFINNLTSKFNEFNIFFNSTIINNDWNETTFINTFGDSTYIKFLPLIIPFDENGAIETFLLNAIKNNSIINDSETIDKLVVEQCVHFIDNIDCRNKYLLQRRDITKAKFDTVFVVMTPATAFTERQTLLRSIPWKEYESIQESFKKLSHLG